MEGVSALASDHRHAMLSRMRPKKTSRRAVGPLVSAVVCLVVAITSAIIACSHGGAAFDHRVFAAIGMPVGSGLWNDADRFNDLVPDLVVITGLTTCALAARIRTHREAIAIGCCIVTSAALAETLKRAGVAVPASRVLTERLSSWPSTHIAAVAALSGSALFIPTGAGPRWAATAAMTTAVAVTCLSLLVTSAHTPFDLIGGAAIAGVVCSVAAWLLS